MSLHPRLRAELGAELFSGLPPRTVIKRPSAHEPAQIGFDERQPVAMYRLPKRP